jgi:biopolymer transport protein ExbD
MSKFKKQKKGLPPISTASLPDIIFMLLFFFMTVTTMRETDLVIKEPELPSAKTVKKVEDKNLVSTIYIGKSREEGTKGDFIQLNDKLARVEDVRAFILNSRANKSDDDVLMMSTLFKADKGTKVGTLADIKKELREIEALKIAYAASQKVDNN